MSLLCSRCCCSSIGRKPRGVSGSAGSCGAVRGVPGVPGVVGCAVPVRGVDGSGGSADSDGSGSGMGASGSGDGGAARRFFCWRRDGVSQGRHRLSAARIPAAAPLAATSLLLQAATRGRRAPGQACNARGALLLELDALHRPARRGGGLGRRTRHRHAGQRLLRLLVDLRIFAAHFHRRRGVARLVLFAHRRGHRRGHPCVGGGGRRRRLDGQAAGRARLLKLRVARRKAADVALDARLGRGGVRVRAAVARVPLGVQVGALDHRALAGRARLERRERVGHLRRRQHGGRHLRRNAVPRAQREHGGADELRRGEDDVERVLRPLSARRLRVASLARTGTVIWRCSTVCSSR
ncbi:hypothetical protein FA09DRAFT_208868 [Tilletiopsis washingtonensis]|uniref:Uncharacterized protein n=1 Tax=Tilletiopsis washingtonensis TaxID=58919 RepID=A0A316ZGM8_9BASI|nr:hypothetical protein FA09DRAFT_208868 [Tilletiopsis washingtonensis]PWO00175.1 hypothetical protein FA09DRAFT_208868 [Tilletiopsis washingtonensis]